jgi:hypothetical protein
MRSEKKNQQKPERPTSQNLTRRALLSGAAVIGVSAYTAPVASALAQTTSAPRQPAQGTLEIKRNGSQPAAKGDPRWFTGALLIDQPFQADEPARVGGAR